MMNSEKISFGIDSILKSPEQKVLPCQTVFIYCTRPQYELSYTVEGVTDY